MTLCMKEDNMTRNYTPLVPILSHRILVMSPYATKRHFLILLFCIRQEQVGIKSAVICMLSLNPNSMLAHDIFIGQLCRQSFFIRWALQKGSMPKVRIVVNK